MAEMEPIMADVSAAAMVNARALAEEDGAAAASVCRALHKAAWVSPSDDRTAVLAERSVRHILRLLLLPLLLLLLPFILLPPCSRPAPALLPPCSHSTILR